jgi:hypothetical protein
MTLVTVDPVGSADYTVRGRRKSVPRVVDQYAGWYSHAPRFDVWQGTGLVPGTLPDITGKIAVPQPRQSVGPAPATSTRRVGSPATFRAAA